LFHTFAVSLSYLSALLDPESDKLLIIRFLHVLPEAMGLTHQIDDVGIIGEAIQECRGQPLYSKNLPPIGKL